MKSRLLLLGFLSCFLVFQSCEKETVSEPSYPITGYWVGTYNIQQAVEDANSLHYSFFIRRDDSIQVQGLGADGLTYYGLGTWTLNDSTFNATIKTTNLSQLGVVQNLTATYDKKKGLLTNGRVETVGANFIGSFELSRSN